VGQIGPPAFREMAMRKLRFVGAGCALGLMAAGLSPSALAADYPLLRGSQYEPTPTQMGTSTTSNGIDWNGFTIGAHAGLSRTYFDFDTSLQTLAATPLRQTSLLTEANPPSWIRTRSGEDRGASYGFTIGYNYMIDDILLGFEGDYTRAGQSHRSTDVIGRRVGTSNGDVNDVVLTSTQSMRLQDYATARVRIGVAYGRFMPFISFGGAVGRFDIEKSVNIDWRFQRGAAPMTNAFGFPTTVTENRRDQYGYGLTAGLGMDVALTDFAFVRGEYLFTRFADVKGATVDVNTIRAVGGVKF
jgi:opacity protein-like surface antigen